MKNTNKLLVCLFLLLLAGTGCKKAQQPSATRVPTPKAKLNDPLSVVSYDGTAITIDSFSHLGDILDSLANMSATGLQNWEQSLGFISLRTTCNQALDAYAVMADGLSSTGAELSAADITAFRNSVANAVTITDDDFHINLSYEQLGNLINQNHIMYVENSVIYCDKDIFVCIPQSEYANLNAYKTMPNDLIDDTHTVYHAQMKTSSSCRGQGHYYIGEINCGSPLAKRSRIYFNIDLYHINGGGGYWIHLANMYFPIDNQKRGFLGFWYPEKRGTQVDVNYSSSYFSLFYTHQYVWPNDQSAPVHYLPLYQFISGQTPQQFANSFCVTMSGHIYVAPMCSGNILSLAF